MMDLPPFPVDEAHFAEWSVYADHLLGAGDPRGDAIALDLSLPALSSRDTRAPLAAAVRRVSKQGHAIEIGWCLGHARTIALRRIPDDHPAGHSTLANLRNLLRSRAGSRVESLELAYSQDWIQDPATRKNWARLMAAIPPSCTRLDLAIPRLDDSAAETLLATVPGCILTLGLEPLGDEMNVRESVLPFLVDRFEAVEVGPIYPAIAPAIVARLSATSRVVLRASKLIGPALVHSRVELGRPGSAALVERGPVEPSAYACPPWSLLATQRRHGIVPIRTQIARALPESYGLAIPGAAIDLVHRRGAWTARGLLGALTINGIRVPHPPEAEHSEIAAIAHGDRIEIDTTPFTFFTEDVTRHANEILATSRTR